MTNIEDCIKCVDIAVYQLQIQLEHYYTQTISAHIVATEILNDESFLTSKITAFPIYDFIIDTHQKIMYE